MENFDVDFWDRGRMLVSVDFTVEHDHGILVIEQLGSRAEHEEWDDSVEGAHLESDSVHVGVLPTMEGSVTTSIRSAGDSGARTDGLELTFEGRLAVPRRILLIGDSDRNVEIRVPVRSSTVDVSVFVDEIGLASRVLVVLDETSDQ